jgi:predicted deacylase
MAVELAPPDIEPYRAGNAGIPYSFSFVGPTPGPHLLITALIHGNEICGAVALDFLLRQGIRPTRGRLSLCFANTAAYARFDPAQPEASRFVAEDMNRLWDTDTLDAEPDTLERLRAREIRPLVDSCDHLLDLHSMQCDTEPLSLCGMLDKGLSLAARLALPGLIVADPGHKAGARLRDYGAFAEAGDPRSAVLVECGPHWYQRTADTAIQVCLNFLHAFGMLDADCQQFRNPSPPPRRRVVEVTDVITVTADRFEFTQAYNGLDVIDRQGTVIAYDGSRPIATPYDFCVLILPSRGLSRGQTAVRLGRFRD